MNAVPKYIHLAGLSLFKIVSKPDQTSIKCPVAFQVRTAICGTHKVAILADTYCIGTDLMYTHNKIDHFSKCFDFLSLALKL